MESNDKAQQLLDFVDSMELAAKRGLELNHKRDPLIPAEKTISVEYCECILKDCAVFRSVICDVFGFSQ